jgi:D,D-heptose 1,7-bisphosphate phosphatase
MNKAVFLDRDGTLNPDPGYISDPADFSLFDGVAETLAKLQEAGYLLVLITNQSGIARGLIRLEELDAIHAKLQGLLAAAGTKLDGIYFCPHHPDFSYEGVTSCSCRKPGSQLLLDAIEDLNIEVANSYMVGDRVSDVKSGIGAGVQPIYIGEKPLEGFENVPTFSSLCEAGSAILEKKVK